MTRRKEISFGIIPIKEGKTLLVKHRKGHWAFPKGHAEEGEKPEESACRELFEETGLKVTALLGPSFEESYCYADVDKRVTYFLAEVSGEINIQPEEIEEVRWLTLGEAHALATFPECRRLINELYGASF